MNDNHVRPATGKPNLTLVKDTGLPLPVDPPKYDATECYRIAFMTRVRFTRRMMGEASAGPVARLACLSRYTQNFLRTYLTPVERKLFKEERRNCLFAQSVAKLLGCRVASVTRWDEDGRLPHDATRARTIPGRTIPDKVWFRCNVEAALDHVTAWIEADKNGLSDRARAREEARREVWQ